MMDRVLANNDAVRLQILLANSVNFDDAGPRSSTEDAAAATGAPTADDEPCGGTGTQPGGFDQTSLPGPGRAFENVLAQTWVYSRARDNATDMSFSTGLFDSRSWGVISGLSLGEISNIAVIRLPVSTDAMEEATSGWYWENTHVPPAWGSKTRGDHSASRAPATTMLPRRYTIAMVGDGGVGKSSMASQVGVYIFSPGKNVHANNGSAPLTNPTLTTTQLCFGSILPRALDFTIQDSYTLDITVDGRKSPCQIIDTSGQEGYEILLQDAIEDADGVIVVFSLDSIQSFHRAKSLLDVVRAAKGSAVGREGASSDNTATLPVALVGNKLDLSLKRQVSRYDAASAAKRASCASFECSALSGKGVLDPFCEVIRVAGRSCTSAGAGIDWI